MRCRCGFEGPIQGWSMKEKSGFKRFDKTYRAEVAQRPDIPLLVKVIALFLPVPYHSTLFVCPRCGSPAGSST